MKKINYEINYENYEKLIMKKNYKKLWKQCCNAQNVLWYKAVWIMPNYLLEYINAAYVRRPGLKAKENIK